jgi:hypothetical protein
MIEHGARPAAPATHAKAEALQALNPRLEGKLAEKTDVQVLNPLPVGADELGRLRP